MPELPEVEVTRASFADRIAGAQIVEAHMGKPLRWPLNCDPDVLVGQHVLAVRRRGKYLLFVFDPGVLIVHLGMSGSLRVVPCGEAPRVHDHLDVVFGAAVLRLRDPRRFGAVLWEGGDVAAHRLIAPLGVEPLSDAFTGDWLRAAMRGWSLLPPAASSVGDAGDIAIAAIAGPA